VSDYCARAGHTKVLADRWLDDADHWRAPAFRDALSFLDCSLVDTLEAGTHTVLLGEVCRIGIHEDIDTRSPLIHFRGAYRHLEAAREPHRLVPLPIVLEDIS
jgi:flavin reductase (DIM6/NTAB) family NADH-FMN oxidoreductase RutF